MKLTPAPRIVRAALAAALIGLALAGCGTAAVGSAPVSSGSATVAATAPSVTPTAVPMTPVLVVPVAGVVLTPAQAKTLPDGIRAYPMSDGSLVAVVRGEVLPAPVVAEITSKAQVTIAGGFGTGYEPSEASQAKTKALKAAISEAGVATGRKVIAIFPVYGYRTATSGLTHFWNTTRYDGSFFGTEEEAQADVERAFAANPTGISIVVLGK